MGEDRRPNFGGQDFPERAEAQEEISGRELQREAKLLRDRKRADGHEPARPEDQKKP